MSSNESGDFYALLADHYDGLFGCSETLASFLAAEGARDGTTALDVACGTGACTRALVARGVDCHGIDLSAPMIERARRLAARNDVEPDRFSVGDMLEIDSHHAAPVDTIFCVGNSIAHLPTHDHVSRFMRVARDALRTTLVVQFVAVSGLPVGDALDLPDLTDGSVTMHRRYRRDDETHLTFDARLETGSGESGRASQRLLVLDPSAIVADLERAGFGDTDTFGGFDRSEPEPDGWLRVIVARP